MYGVRGEFIKSKGELPYVWMHSNEIEVINEGVNASKSKMKRVSTGCSSMKLPRY